MLRSQRWWAEEGTVADEGLEDKPLWGFGFFSEIRAIELSSVI